MIRRLLAHLPTMLAADGVALLEIGGDQGETIGEAVESTVPGWPWRVERDLAGLPRVALVSRRVALTGCDTWSYGPVPAEDPDLPFVVPQTLNTRHGVVVVENLRLADLAAAGVHEFMLVISHAKLRGATGAWVAPLAIV